jgi:hypothetical protein
MGKTISSNRCSKSRWSSSIIPAFKSPRSFTQQKNID